MGLRRVLALVSAAVVGAAGIATTAHASPPGGIAAAARAAQARYGVPASVLEAICYLEGRLSDHGGAPSANGGYGCMNLVRGHSLGQAARLTGASSTELEHGTAANIAGAAAVLRADAVRLNHGVPSDLGGWYGAIAAYSGASHRVAVAYADEVYRIIRGGLTATAPSGETVRIAPTPVTPDTATAATVGARPAALPTHCQAADSSVDYPGAYDCIVPTTYDCNSYSACTYQSANRPSDLPILGITIHDTEESLSDTITTFWSTSSGVSITYVVDTDGSVYQLLHEKDIAYHNGNFWYNQRFVGIEHIGYDATGYQWYNATQYLGSAMLSAYLATKYDIPLDHDHIMSHGTTPAPTLGTSPNHVDPGPYWLWSYYLTLIHQQGVAWPSQSAPSGVIRLNPAEGQAPGNPDGTETTANFGFFSLYTQPSTASTPIPGKGSAGDITDESDNVEAMTSYVVLAQQPDAAGTGDTMYEIWYGETQSSSSWTATGAAAWLAVPAGGAEQGYGTVVTLTSKNGKALSVYGKPGGTSSYVVGSSPSGSVYLSPWAVSVSGTTWYCINFNHRQEWVPASEVGSTRTS